MSLHPALAASVDSVGRAPSVESGVIVLLKGLHTQLNTALAGAKANGATDEELKPLTELIGALGVSGEDVSVAFHGKPHGKTPAEEAAEVERAAGKHGPHGPHGPHDKDDANLKTGDVGPQTDDDPWAGKKVQSDTKDRAAREMRSDPNKPGK